MRKTFSLPVAATAAGGGPTPPPADTVDNIEHSVRLNSADSAQLTKTFSSAGNTETNTISLWVKRNKISYALDTYQSFLSAGNNFIWHFDTADRLGLYQGGFIRYTTQKFRDPSAWYHFVFATDTTQSAASDQIKVYVNGQLITDWDVETALTQNTTLTWNSNVLHNIGSNNNTQYPDIQIADVQSIDGQALTPSSFGFTDSNGVWQPKAYTGSYDNLLKISSSAYSTSGTSWNNTREWDDLFAETLSDAVYAADGTTYTVTFSPALTVSSEVKITKYSGQGIPTAEYVLNGSVTRTVSNFTNHVDTISSATLGGSLSSIALETVNGSDAATVIELTVDGKPVRLDTITGNGFHLDFADTSSATALGNDVSGNNNDFTPSGLVAGPAYTANSFSTEFDGTDDYLSIPDDTSLDLGTGDYTVEAWIYPAAVSGLKEILTKGHGFQVYHNGTSLSLAVSSDGSTYDIASSFGTIAANQWYHVAVTRSGGTTRAFLNGTLGLTDTASTTIHNNTDAFVIADYGPSLVYGFNGKVSNVRVIKGRALYTAAFTPPSTALTAVTDTVLLTCQDSTFIDNSASAHTITANNGAATTTVSPFEPVDGSDAMLDSPTNYGSGDTVRGNYCTLNPLDKASNITLSNGNLDFSSSGNTWHIARSTFAVSSGKWYWEAGLTSGGEMLLGLSRSGADFDTYLGGNADGWGYNANGGDKYHNASFSTYGASYAVNDVIGIAFDADNGTLVFYKNGVSQGTAYTGLTSGPYFPTVSTYASSGTANFGQQPFKYPAPSGYKSLCSTNLPTPAVADGSTAMDVKLYTGNNSTRTISGFGFSPDLVWIKSRAAAYAHSVNDTVRGADRQLFTNLTNAEGTDTNQLTSFTSDGFTLGSNSTGTGGVNFGTGGYAAWAWDAGSSTVSNTDGTITSQVRANPTAGVSIATFTAQSQGSATFGHSLIKTPEFVIIKSRDAAYSWLVWHKSLTSSSYSLILNTTAGESNTLDAWNSTLPTSSVVSLGSAYAGAGNSVAYCFAPVEGFSSFGSYVGDGSSSNGPFVYTGMRPKWIMIKDTTGSTNHWVIYDTERDTYNESGKRLAANLADKEGESNTLGSGIGGIDILSNGFKIDIAGGNHNALNSTYIYAAFAEHPFKTSRAR